MFLVRSVWLPDNRKTCLNNVGKIGNYKYASFVVMSCWTRWILKELFEEKHVMQESSGKDLYCNL